MKDYTQITDGTGTKVKTIQKTQGSDTVEVQSFTRDWDKLDFGGETPNALNSVNTPGTESPDIDCEGMSTIILKVEYSTNAATAPLWIVLKDHNADVGRLYTVKVTPGNTGENDDIQESGYYHGEGVVIPVYGAKSFRVILAATPSDSGFISVWGKAV